MDVRFTKFKVEVSGYQIIQPEGTCISDNLILSSWKLPSANFFCSASKLSLLNLNAKSLERREKNSEPLTIFIMYIPAFVAQFLYYPYQVAVVLWNYH